jgi:hypothetical protein
MVPAGHYNPKVHTMPTTTTTTNAYVANLYTVPSANAQASAAYVANLYTPAPAPTGKPKAPRHARGNCAAWVAQGLVVVPLVTTNPRNKVGCPGWHAMQLVLAHPNGIPVATYLAKHRPEDLKWDLAHGWVALQPA